MDNSVDALSFRPYGDFTRLANAILKNTGLALDVCSRDPLTLRGLTLDIWDPYGDVIIR
jgi:phage tail protein X